MNLLCFIFGHPWNLVHEEYIWSGPRECIDEFWRFECARCNKVKEERY